MRAMVLEITTLREILDTEPVRKRSIRVRNSYLDPISYLLVAWLRQRRTAATCQK
ncbi:MAG: phosphoenolpyruvate carboxylase [Acidobacteriota bacterium]